MRPKILKAPPVIDSHRSVTELSSFLLSRSIIFWILSLINVLIEPVSINALTSTPSIWHLKKGWAGIISGRTAFPPKLFEPPLVRLNGWHNLEQDVCTLYTCSIA